MYVIIYKNKYFCEYDIEGKPTFTTNLSQAWQFLNEKYAKEEIEIMQVKSNKCTIKKI